MAKGLKNKQVILYISAGIMEISWLYALTCILFLMLNNPVFPIWTAILAFFIPIIITFILKGRGRRIIEYVILHFLFYTATSLYTLYIYGNWQENFFDFKWLEMILHQQYGSVGGFAYLLVIFWLSIFWINGFKLAKRSNDHLTITTRFDLGVALLVLAFVISGATGLSLPRSNLIIIYYFLFSMLSIALSKNLQGSEQSNQVQLSGMSLILPFILFVLIFGSWIVLFFLPQLSSAAQAGYQVLKILSKPLGNLLLKMISFLFGYRNNAAIISTDPHKDTVIPIMESSDPTWWSELLKWIITWGAIIILSLFIIGVSAWGLWSLWKWFSTKTELDTGKKSFFEELLLWLLHQFYLSKKVLGKLLNILKNMWGKQENISLLFQKLCRWGHSSGVPRENSKTPQEYGKYLTRFFPNSQGDIQLIIETFNQEIYGKKFIKAEHLKKAKIAWQRLSSPSKWPLRLWVKITILRE